MNDRLPDLDDLIRAHRKGVRLTSAQRERNRSRILSRVAAGAALASAVGTTSTAVATTAGAALVTKVAIVLAAIGAAGTAYYVSGHAAPAVHPSAEPTRVAATVRTAEPAEPAPPAVPEEPPSEIMAPAATSRPPAKSKAENASSLANEVQLLRDVDAALQAGQPERALQLLDSHRGGQRSGAMGEERAAARVVTLCRLGRVNEARAEAARFVRERPRSPLIERVRSSCGAK